MHDKKLKLYRYNQRFFNFTNIIIHLNKPALFMVRFMVRIGPFYGPPDGSLYDHINSKKGKKKRRLIITPLKCMSIICLLYAID